MRRSEKIAKASQELLMNLRYLDHHPELVPTRDEFRRLLARDDAEGVLRLLVLLIAKPLYDDVRD